MLFGHNTNVKAGDTTFHVQTEDRGTTNALIDTTVYFRGRVLHRRTNNYFDLLPLDPGREQALKLRLDDQHRHVIEEIRSGALTLPLPPTDNTFSDQPPPHDPAPTPKPLHLELINANSWLSGKRATLQLAVRYGDTGGAVGNARVAAHVEGSAGGQEFTAQTGIDGRANLEFDMPRLTSPEAILVIDAANGSATAQLRFHLRAKPRVPSAS